MRFKLAAALSVSVVLGAHVAEAVEVESVGGRPMQIDITNTAVLNWHFDNRNSVLGVVGTRVDDNYGEFLDRFNLQLNWWNFRAGFRFDVATYFATVSLEKDVPKLVSQDYPDTFENRGPRNNLSNAYRRDLNTRYVGAYYPAKLFVGYGQPGIDAALGDFYAQLGRGLVFSARKIDELAVDTTVRGGKLVLEKDFGSVHVGGVAFAGEMNPVRIDETSGRRLNGTGDPLFFGFPESKKLLTYGFDPVSGAVITQTEQPRASYLEDAVFGGHLEAGPKQVLFGLNGLVLRRRDYRQQNARCKQRNEDTRVEVDGTVSGLCAEQFPVFTYNDPSREHDTIGNFSGSVNIPSLGGHGDLYVEVAGQKMADGSKTYKPNGAVNSQVKDTDGYAVYVSASGRNGPLTVSFEGRHYRRFFPLAANVDQITPGFAAPEFALVSYSQPPTAEAIFVEPAAGGNPIICVTGGRALANYRFTPGAALFAWLERSVSFSEADSSNSTCKETPDKQTNTWDVAAGTELFFENRKSKLNAYFGARTQNRVEAADTQAGLTDVFYQEGYVRYDAVKHVAGPFSIQAQGVHRHRFEPETGKEAWWEGENYTALQWSPHFSAIFGFEYLLKNGCERGAPLGDGVYGKQSNGCTFYNGGMQWRSNGSGKVAGMILDTVSAFVGQRRGALRCVSGVCRQFPPFEGAKLEMVSRF